jgi:hypothetical protein
MRCVCLLTVALIDDGDSESGVAVSLFRSRSLICLTLLCLALSLL